MQLEYSQYSFLYNVILFFDVHYQSIKKKVRVIRQRKQGRGLTTQCYILPDLHPANLGEKKTFTSFQSLMVKGST